MASEIWMISLFVPKIHKRFGGKDTLKFWANCQALKDDDDDDAYDDGDDHEIDDGDDDNDDGYGVDDDDKRAHDSLYFRPNLCKLIRSNYTILPMYIVQLLISMRMKRVTSRC